LWTTFKRRAADFFDDAIARVDDVAVGERELRRVAIGGQHLAGLVFDLVDCALELGLRGRFERRHGESGGERNKDKEKGGAINKAMSSL
jgi:hypothetical protein